MEHSSDRLGLSKARLESLADGIFAFAMTLLAFGVGFPLAIRGMPATAIGNYIVSLYPDFIHYVIAFIIVAAFWMSHHMQSHHIKFVDRGFLWLNIIALMFIALIPFSSSIAGDFPNVPLTALVFEINLLVAGLFFHVQWQFATKNHHLIDKNLSPSLIRSGKELTLVIPVFSCAGIVLALLNIPYSAGVYLIVPVFLLFRYIGPLKMEF